MRTISQVVEEIIERSPFLAEAMHEGIANNAKVARRIKSEVEKRLLEDVSEASVAMALHRIGKISNRTPFGARFLKHINDITVRSNLVEYVFPNSTDMPALTKLALSAARGNKDTFVHFSRGLHESLLVINKDAEKNVLEGLKRQKTARRIENLSAITMRLPKASLNVPGVYYPILKALALEGISFVEVLSVNTEFGILFEDKDVDHAFSTIKKLTSAG